ncbi:hypothetical protein [Aurantiacibacter sediminis]|uniref:Uncharacterized protein n=1 Tax=Aurantiacibacter sediminis TaxID=2793064 RepID=A0ABS0N5G8_9SPHN|nr:hypothetical protein [Aurantiacibacter sediminis]MBH5323016.1 hypothetical protein [Aurantiacibacter sediminis]
MAKGELQQQRLLRRLALAGIAVFLLISADYTRRSFDPQWRLFDETFADTANAIWGQAGQPIWLYAIAFPAVIWNFGCMVQMARGRSRGLFKPYVVTAAIIAIVPIFAWQLVLYKTLWEVFFTALGYAICGAIAVLLYLGLDSQPDDARDADKLESD